MEQTPIRDYNDQRYSTEEGAAIIKELNDRTEHSESGYNSISELGSKVKILESSVQSGIKTYQTYADLPSASGLDDGTPVKVANDSTASNNGYYSVVSGAWVKDADLVENTVDESNTTKGISGKSVFDFTVDSLKKNKGLFADDATLDDAQVNGLELLAAIKFVYLNADQNEQYFITDLWNEYDNSGTTTWLLNIGRVSDNLTIAGGNFTTSPQGKIYTLNLTERSNSGITGVVKVDFSKLPIGNFAFTSSEAKLGENIFSETEDIDTRPDLFSDKGISAIANVFQGSPIDYSSDLIAPNSTPQELIQAIKSVYMYGNIDENDFYYIGAIWTGYDNGSGVQYHLSVRKSNGNTVSRYLVSEEFYQGEKVYELTPLNNSGIYCLMAFDASKLQQNVDITPVGSSNIKLKKVYSESWKNKTFSFENKIENKIQALKSDLGALNLPDKFNTDYIDIISYGQSLSVGSRTYIEMTDVAYEDTFMIGSSPLSSINNGNNGNEVLSPLVSNAFSWFAEQPVTAMIGSFKRLFDRLHKSGYSKKFIGCAAGEGGQSIETLSKGCTNTTSGTTSDNYYNLGITQHLNQVKNTVDALSSSVSCPAIFYMQGESNYSGTGKGLTAGSDQTLEKEPYKALLLQLKNDMQEDIMSIYGQTERPIFFIYQTCGGWVANKEQKITQAQIEFAKENEDVFLLNPHYAMPKVFDYHLTSNGSRQYGEMIARDFYNVFIKNKETSSIEFFEPKIENNVIYIDCKAEVFPLIFETKYVETIQNYGFSVYKDLNSVSINKIEIIDGCQIKIYCDEFLKGNIEITYGDNSKNGTGNLRDSQSATSLYYYEDDVSATNQPIYQPLTQDGGSIIGEKYPLWNWANLFYYQKTI